MKNNNREKEIKDHVDNFFEGLFDTSVGTPVAFGEFLGRISGFKDWQDRGVVDLGNKEQKQALHEVRILYEALTHEASRTIIIKALKEDIKERPAYYAGGIGIQTAMSTTLSKIGKAVYSTTIAGTKMEKVMHEKYDSIKAIDQLGDEKFNMLYKDIFPTTYKIGELERNINMHIKGKNNTLEEQEYKNHATFNDKNRADKVDTYNTSNKEDTNIDIEIQKDIGVEIRIEEVPLSSSTTIANETLEEQEPFDPTTHAQNLINNLYPHLAPTQANSESTRELYEDMATTPYVPTDTQSTVEISVTDFSPQLQNYLEQFAPQVTQGNDSSYDMGMEIE